MGVFSFWELSFSGIFVKLSKEWDPSVWLVPSSNVSLPVILCLFSFSIFFLLPRAFSSYWPFIAPPQATTTTPVINITSNHQIGTSSSQIGSLGLLCLWFGFAMHLDLEIGSFATDISLNFAFATAAAAEAVNAAVHCFRLELHFLASFFFFFALRCSSSSSSAMWDFVVDFLYILLDFLCGCWWFWW